MKKLNLKRLKKLGMVAHSYNCSYWVVFHNRGDGGRKEGEEMGGEGRS
jgi:hypothetical protein